MESMDPALLERFHICPITYGNTVPADFSVKQNIRTAIRFFMFISATSTPITPSASSPSLACRKTSLSLASLFMCCL